MRSREGCVRERDALRGKRKEQRQRANTDRMDDREREREGETEVCRIASAAEDSIG